MSIADVWWWPIPATVHSQDLAPLSYAENQRVSRAKSPATKAAIAGARVTVRRILSEVLGVPPEGIELGRLPCPGCANAHHGPPAVLLPATSLRISISHTVGCAALAVSQEPVGVDVEQRRNLPVERLSRVVLSGSEREHLAAHPEGPERDREFLRCWTRKEAVLKAVGIGIATNLTEVETRPGSVGPVDVEAGARAGAAELWSVTDLALPEPWQGALAVRAGQTGAVRVHKHE